MQQLDFIVMGVYLLAIIAGGLAMVRIGTDTKSFFGAGGHAPWWISGLSLYMSFFSAGTFVVWGAIAYDLGWVSVTIQWGMCLAGLVTALVIAPRWRRTGALTAAEFIQKRLGTGLQQFYSYIVLIYGAFLSGSYLYPVAKMVAVATPFPLEMCIMAIGGGVILYTAVGGLWAVLITDTLQFVILTVAVIAIVPLAIISIGGFSPLATETPDDFFAIFNGEYTQGFIMAFVVYSIFFLGGQWGYVQRYTSVTDERAARKVGLTYTALYVISPVIWMLPPMIYRVVNPDLGGLESEGAYILMSEWVLPAGIIGLMFSAMISATASSANTTLNILAAVFTHDIYKQLIRPVASEREQMLVARLSTVFFGISIVVVALLVEKMGGIVNLVLTLGALAGGPIMAPPIWALFSRRLTATGAFTTTVGGLFINFAFKFLTPAWLDLSLSRAEEMTVGVGVPMLILVVFEVYAWMRGTIDEGYDKAYLGTTIVQHSGEKDIRVEQTRYSVRVLSFVMGFIGVALMFLTFFTPEKWLVPLAMGIIILLLSVLVWQLQWRHT